MPAHSVGPSPLLRDLCRARQRRGVHSTISALDGLGVLAGQETRPDRPWRAPVAGRAVVTWEGPGEPIMLTLYGADSEVAVPLLPKRA